jgi:hypothetical protein
MKNYCTFEAVLLSSLNCSFEKVLPVENFYNIFRIFVLSHTKTLIFSVLVLLFFFSTVPLVAQTVIFRQDFNGAAIPGVPNSQITNTEYYTTIGEANKFTKLQWGNQNSSYIDINSNTPDYLYVQDGGSGFVWMMSRTADIATPAPTAVKITFNARFDVNSTGTSNPRFIFQIGSGFSDAFSTTNMAMKEPDANVYAGFGIKSQHSSDGATLFQNDGSTQIGSTVTMDGGMVGRILENYYTWTIVLNNTGTPLTYTDPTGAIESLANDAFDLWIGTTKWGNDIVATTPSQSMTNFKFGSFTNTSSGRIHVYMDWFQIENLCTQPEVYDVSGSGNLCNGATLRVNGSEAGVTYELYKDNVLVSGSAQVGAGGDYPEWSPLPSAGTYTVKTSAVDGYCSVSMTGSVTVAPITPNITLHPSVTPQNLCVGEEASELLIAAIGDGMLSYQWYSSTDNANNTPADDVAVGANSDSYTPSTAAIGTLYYYCVVTNTCTLGSAIVTTTMSGGVTVSPNTQITSQPVDANGCANATVSIGATGAGTLTYQWQYSADGVNDWANVLNGTPVGSTYTYPTPVSPATHSLRQNVSSAYSSSGYYRCVVSGTCGGSVISNVVQIAVANNPTVGSLSPPTFCEGDNFNMTAPTVNTNGSVINATAWQIRPGGLYADITLPYTLTAADNTKSVRYRVNYTCGSNIPANVTSLGVTMTVNSKPVISAQPMPEGQSVCKNATPANITITASAGSGTISTYQWYSSTDATIGNADDVQVGTNSDTYTPPTTTVGTMYYYCVVTNSTSCSTTSNMSGAIIVRPLTQITTQPLAHTECQGGSNGFSVVAVGDGTLTYQWYKDGNPIGTNSSSYSISNITGTHAGLYKVDVTGGCGTLTSNEVALTVISQPGIVISGVSPTSPVFCAGDTFSATATVNNNGSTITHESWEIQKNVGGFTVWEPISMPYNVVDENDNKKIRYHVVATCGTNEYETATTVYSSTAITVKPLPTLSSTLTPSAICSGNTFSYTAQSGFSGVSFSWSRAVVSGISQGVSSGSDATISETLTNITNSPIEVTYVFSMTLNGCSSQKEVKVVVNPIPQLFTISDGDAYCDNTPGIEITLDGSVLGTSYQLKYEGENLDVPVAGTGNSITFGLQTEEGLYTVKAYNGYCYRDMDGSAYINILTTPSISTIYHE